MTLLPRVRRQAGGAARGAASGWCLTTSRVSSRILVCSASADARTALTRIRHSHRRGGRRAVPPELQHLARLGVRLPDPVEILCEQETNPRERLEDRALLEVHRERDHTGPLVQVGQPGLLRVVHLLAVPPVGLLAGGLRRASGVGTRGTGNAGVLPIQTAQAVRVCAQGEAPGPRRHRLGGGQVARLRFVGRLVHTGERVLGEPTACGGQQVRVLRTDVRSDSQCCPRPPG